MQPKTHVESFDLDHTKVRAPYVRLAGKYRTRSGDAVTKFDLRLVQPNSEEIPTAALHTIEHLFAGYLRDALEVTIVDASPMGCRTGFYLTVLDEPTEDAVVAAFRHGLSGVAQHEGPIPGCSPERCGNYRDHSLHGAQEWARRVLGRDIIVQDTIPLPRD